MIHVLHDQSATEARRHAYNAAFEELGLNWHWDSATFSGLQASGREGVRKYLENQHPHLLRAYDADFLLNAIEITTARYQAAMTGFSTASSNRAGWSVQPQIRLAA